MFVKIGIIIFPSNVLTSTMKIDILMILLVLMATVLAFVSTENLASSSYPINKANLERNNHINRTILCSAIANGRTTVLNRENTIGGSNYFPYWIPPVLDENNYLYSQTNGAVVKIDLSTFNHAKSVSFGETHITVGGSNLYFSSATTTAIYRKSDLQQQATAANTGGNGTSSLVPFSLDLFIRANIGDAYSSIMPSYAFLNTSTGQFDSTLPVPSVGSPRDVIVYKTATDEIPIFIGQYEDVGISPMIMVSGGPGRYALNITNARLRHGVDPFIVDNVLYIFSEPGRLYGISPATGIIYSVKPWPILNNSTLVKTIMRKDDKVLASLETASEKNIVMELIKNTTVLSDWKFAGNPVFSLIDNIVLMSVVDPTGYVKLLGLDWNDWSVKVIGEVGVPSNAVTSEPVIGEDCSVHIIVDGELHTYKPLPLQKVVPVIECIESDNTAYFSFDNLESRSFNIPFVSDRNNLMPMEKAPVTSFGVGSGVHYPLAPSIVLTTNLSESYKWILEDYILEFSNSQALRCPTNVSLVMQFAVASSVDASSFGGIVRQAFLTVTGITDGRVVVSRSAMRSRAIHQNDDSSLEVELQVSPGNQGEPSPSNVVTNFVTNQQTDFNNQVSSDPNAPSNVTLTSISTKQPETAQRGVPTQAGPIINNVPVTSSTSHLINSVVLVIVMFFLMTLLN